jgi:hypothetical protein
MNTEHKSIQAYLVVNKGLAKHCPGLGVLYSVLNASLQRDDVKGSGGQSLDLKLIKRNIIYPL